MITQICIDDPWWSREWQVRRDGNQIWIGDSSVVEGPSAKTATLGLLLLDDGGIAADPEWIEKQVAQRRRLHTWASLLRRLKLPIRLQANLDPPQESSFSGERGMFEYLYGIGTGKYRPDWVRAEDPRTLLKALADLPEEETRLSLEEVR